MSQSAVETKAYLALLEQQARAADALATDNATVQAGIANYNGRGSFRWGRHDRRTAGFQPPHRSGDAAIWDSDDLMARRIRDQARNEPQIKRIRDAMEDLIVGEGVRSFADPFDPLVDLSALTGDTLDEYLAYALESDELFEEWFNSTQFDISGKRTGPDVQRMLIGENVERGGALLIRTAVSGRDRILPLAFQVVEYDELDHSFDRPGGPGVNKIINGVELDAMGREVAFHIYDAHPFDDFSGAGQAGKSSRVRAERVIHLALFRRPSQSIGVNFLTACAQPCFDRDKFIGSEIQTAAKNALLLLVQKVKNFAAAGNLGLDDDTPGSDQYGNEEMKLGNSPVALRIPAEDEIELLECNRPTDSADSFLNILDHDTAGASGLSYYTLTGRYDSTSFSSVRAAKLDEDLHLRPLQNWFGSRVVLPVRREFHKQAIALGLLKSATAEDYLANPRRFNRFDAIGPGRDLLDPEAESNAAAGLLRTCLSTLKQQCAKRGLHWIRVLRQIALENHVLDTLGIALDLSKGQGGQAVGNTRSAEQVAEAQKTQNQPAGNSGRAASRTRQGAAK